MKKSAMKPAFGMFVLFTTLGSCNSGQQASVATPAPAPAKNPETRIVVNVNGIEGARQDAAPITVHAEASAVATANGEAASTKIQNVSVTTGNAPHEAKISTQSVLVLADEKKEEAPAPAPEAPKTEGGEVTKVKVGVLTDPKNPANFQFDTKSFEVPAGGKVMILFQNEKDLLMHNFMIAKAGSLAVVTAAADKAAVDPNYMKNNCLLTIPEILFSGKKLLKAGENELIEFTAPAEPGDYPFVCTFPGHARTMHGIMKVVKK